MKSDDRHAGRLAVPVVPGTALVALVLLELVRLWFPAVLFVIGDAGTTSALLLAPIGLLPLALPLVATSALRVLRPHHLWWIGLPLLGLARTALLVTDGGLLQAGVLAVGVAGGGIALVAVAGSVPGGAGARIAVLLGFVAAGLLHAATGIDPVWLEPPVGPTISVLLIVGLLVTGPRTGRALARLGAGTSSARASRWLLLGPALVLLTVVTAAPGRIAVATGWSGWQVGAAIAAVHVGAVVAALVALRLGPAISGWTGAAAVLLGTAGALQPRGWSTVASTGLVCVGIGLLLATDPPSTTDSGARNRARAAGAGLLLFAVLVGVYYTAYDVALPFGNRWLLLGSALLAAWLGVTGALGVAGVRPPGRRDRVPVVAACLIGAAAVLAVGLLADTAPRDAAARVTADDHIRLALYNVRYGYGHDGAFAVPAQAEVLRAHAPDVVVLNEVDRGWFIAGGHDVLALLSTELGLPHGAFAPAADEVFGNALLSRFPVTEFATERLPRGSDPMPRSQFVALLDVRRGPAQGQPGPDDAVAIVGTHLSHVDDQSDTRLPQARAVAGTVAQLRARGIPTIVAGDLNAGPDSAELASLTTLLTDVVPPGAATYPADAPTEAIDRVLASSELRATEILVPDTTASDHRPVVVTFRWLDG